MSAVANKLREARALIKRPGSWLQKFACRNERGELCYYTEATCFCAYGALCSVTLDDDSGKYEPLELLNDVVGGDGIIAFNDDPGRTQAEVLAAFDKAIALAEQGAEQ